MLNFILRKLKKCELKRLEKSWESDVEGDGVVARVTTREAERDDVDEGPKEAGMAGQVGKRGC
jgi:hypothetical protein